MQAYQKMPPWCKWSHVGLKLSLTDANGHCIFDSCRGMQGPHGHPPFNASASLPDSIPVDIFLQKKILHWQTGIADFLGLNRCQNSFNIRIGLPPPLPWQDGEGLCCDGGGEKPAGGWWSHPPQCAPPLTDCGLCLGHPQTQTCAALPIGEIMTIKEEQIESGHRLHSRCSRWATYNGTQNLLPRNNLWKQRWELHQ